MLPAASVYGAPSSSSSTRPSNNWTPVVLPQMTVGGGRNTFMFPFARAYAPNLAGADIDVVQFTEFIDGLNVAFLGSPVFQAVGIAGQITGIVPHHIAQLVGGSLQLASGLASASISYVRTKTYIREANASLFGPRGLHVRICSTKDLLADIGVNESIFEQSTQSHSCASIPTLYSASANSTSATVDPRMRRLQALERYIAPLSFDVPTPKTPEGVLDKVGAWGAKRQEAKQQKDAEKAMREAREGKGKAQEKLQKKERKIVQKIRWIVITRADVAHSHNASGASYNDDADVDLGLEEVEEDPYGSADSKHVVRKF